MLKMNILETRKINPRSASQSRKKFFYILEVSADFFLDGKTVVAAPNTSFYCLPSAEHRISNIGKTDLKYLVIKKDLR